MADRYNKAAYFATLEQVILSGQMDARQLERHMEEDREFAAWYARRAGQRQFAQAVQTSSAELRKNSRRLSTAKNDWLEGYTAVDAGGCAPPILAKRG